MVPLMSMGIIINQKNDVLSKPFEIYPKIDIVLDLEVIKFLFVLVGRFEVCISGGVVVNFVSNFGVGI